MACLLDFAPGTALVVRGFSADLAPDLRGHLAAWGLMPGTPIQLLAQSPVTRVAIEYTELALEDVAARAILVDPAPTANP
jgi:Fe2+ transport system protein FeoA